MSSNTAAPSVARPFEIAPEDRTARQAEIIKRIEDGPRGRVPINLRMWLNNPDFADVVEPFGLYVGEHSSITERQKEIIILVGAVHSRAQYEWHIHQGHAKKVGITVEQIAAIRKDQAPQFNDEVEDVTCELAATFAKGGAVPAGVYQRAMKVLGHKGVIDVIGLIGLYTMVGLSLNFHDVPAPAGWESNVQL